MKNIIIIIFLFLGINMYSVEKNSEKYEDVKSATETVYNDGKSVITTVYGDLKSIAPSIQQFIVEVAKSLNKGVAEVWGFLVHQQLVISLTYTIFILLGFYGITHSSILYKKHFQNLDPSIEIDKLLAAYTAFLFIGGCVSSWNGWSHLYEIMTGFVNPEYGAMMHILEQIKQI